MLAHALFAALQEERWPDVASLFTAQSAERTKAHAVEMALDEERLRTEELARQSQPGRIARDLGPPWYFRRFGVASLDELRNLRARDVLSRLAAVESPSGVYSGRPDAESSIEYSIVRKVISYHSIGSGAARVVYEDKRTFDGILRVSERSLTLRQVEGQWLADDTAILFNFYHPYPPV
jgi:hypothetical protein